MNQKIETIKNNMFVNDNNWKERAEENSKLAGELREAIMLNIITDRREIVEILDYLDGWGL